MRFLGLRNITKVSRLSKKYGFWPNKGRKSILGLLKERSSCNYSFVQGIASVVTSKVLLFYQLLHGELTLIAMLCLLFIYEYETWSLTPQRETYIGVVRGR
jgi:hypothetical protein